MGTFHQDIEINFTLILENVQFDDKGTSFYLYAIFRPPLKEIGATATIDKVHGTHFSFCFCFACFLCINLIIRDPFFKAHYLHLFHFMGEAACFGT